MRRKVAELRDSLAAFVEQRDDLLLVVSCADPEMVYVLKMLEGSDDGSPGDLFLTFAEPCHDGAQYAAAIMSNLRVQIELARAPLAARGEDPLPPLPALCDDESAPPHARLRAAMDHVSSLVPAEGWHHIVWGFLPLQIGDHEAYARLVAELIPWQGPEPWMRGLRVIARDNRKSPFLIPGLRKKKAPGVLIYEMDMSPAALNDALVQEAADRSLPAEGRMQALMQLAGLDHAYKRYPEALAKYRRLYDFHAEQRAPAMQALALLGVGDVLRQQGDLRGARLRYQQGLTLAMQTQALPVMLHLTSAIGEVDLELGDDRDAEGFFGLAEEIAGKSMNPFAKAQVMENRGIARERLGDSAGAVVSWRGADTLCQSFGDHERRRSVLKRLIRAYKALFLDKERRACEEELAAAVQAIQAGERASHDHPLRQAAT